MLDCNFLSSRRIELGLAQIDVANELGYSVQLVSFWESGKNLPSLQILSKYASILKVDLEGILNSKISKNNDYSDTLIFDVDNFGKNLRHLRKKKKLTQRKLASLIDCPVNAVIRFEKGTSSPTIPQFVELCKIFDKSVDELYFALPSNDISSQVNKKKYRAIPILVPLAILVTIGAITGTIIGVNAFNKMNNSHSVEKSDSTSDISSSEYSSYEEESTSNNDSSDTNSNQE